MTNLSTDQGAQLKHVNHVTCEVRAIVRDLMAAIPDPRKRREALQSVRWRLRGPRREFVGLAAGAKCSFVAESEAQVFDGRDSENMKVTMYEATLGPLTVELVMGGRTAADKLHGAVFGGHSNCCCKCYRLHICSQVDCQSQAHECDQCAWVRDNYNAAGEYTGD